MSDSIQIALESAPSRYHTTNAPVYALMREEKLYPHAARRGALLCCMHLMRNLVLRGGIHRG